MTLKFDLEIYFMLCHYFIDGAKKARERSVCSPNTDSLIH